MTSAASRTPGIAFPTPAGNRYYLLAASNTSCGIGPRRLCAHDSSIEGPRLDSARDLCVADIYTGRPLVL